MRSVSFVSRALAACVAAAFGVAAVPADAASVARLTPPSEKFSSNVDSPIVSRFLPGQRFDLQATILPDEGKTIQSFEFLIDGQTALTPYYLGGIVFDPRVNRMAKVTETGPAETCIDAATNKTKGATGCVLVAGLPANATVVSLRAYANYTAGVHVFSVLGRQNDGTTVRADGNFEIVPLRTTNGQVAKNVIILLGDGMGASHRTAGRIMAKGYAQGRAKGRLNMDTFSNTAMVMTASLNSVVTDSAPGMANYVTGNKAANNQEGVFPDDTLDAFDNPRMEYLSEYLRMLQKKSLGIVTTADVFDATPAANAVHTSARGNGTGIVDQFLDDRDTTGLTVLMGGGRKWFLPNPGGSTSPQPANGSQRSGKNDYVLGDDIVKSWGVSKGKIDPERDLIADFQTAGFAYAPDNTALQAKFAGNSAPDKLLGLFSYSNMNVAFDKIAGRRGDRTVVDAYGFPDQPMLDEMTDKALRVLSKNPNGFVAMIEGASIDKQSHLMDTDRWMLEVLEFDRAVGVAKAFAETHPDTLVIVTADHECSGAAIIGASTLTAAQLTATPNSGSASVGTYDNARFPRYTIAADGYPQTTMVDRRLLIGYGANADRYETWAPTPFPTKDTQQPFSPAQSPENPNVRNKDVGYLITGQVPGDQAVHTATDIPLSAYGAGASLFNGVIDNTDVFFKIGQASAGGL